MEGKYNDFWARKMKKVFNAMDVGKKGYLTLESMITTADTFFAVYPKVDRQTVIAQYERTWKVLYNKGQDVPEGFRLTLEKFLDNLWYSVHQPNFKEEVAAMCKDVLKEMDHDHKYRMTKAEFLKMNSMRAGGEKVATAAFDAMDTSNNGVVVEFTELDKKEVDFYKTLFQTLLTEPSESVVVQVFSRISPFPNLKKLRDSLLIFLNQYLGSKETSKGNSFLEQRLRLIEQSLGTLSHLF